MHCKHTSAPVMVKNAISDTLHVNKVCSVDKNQNVMARKQSVQTVCTDVFNITLNVYITKRK